MPTITKISPQKNKKRVNIYLDGEFSSKGRPVSGWGFGLDLENFVKLGLKVGQEFTESEIEDLVKKAEFQKSLDKILRFAMLRPRSEAEIDLWLIRKKVHPSLLKKLKEKLSDFELLDDEKFARWWIEQRLQFKSKSKRELEYELKQKGIQKDLISLLLSESINQEKEVEMAKNLIEKKIYRWEKLPDQEKKRKIIEFLQRRGFSWEIVKKVLDKND